MAWFRYTIIKKAHFSGSTVSMKNILRIIILSDNPSSAEDIKAALRAEKYLIIGVIRSMDDAFDLIPLIKPDLAIADKQLNEGIDGIDAAEKLNTFCNLPVVFITTEDVKSLLSRIRSTPSYSFLVKPFTKHELQNTVDITYKNFTRRIKNDELSNNTTVYKENPDGTINRGTGMYTYQEEHALIRQLSGIFNEMNEIFQSWIFSKDISLVILRKNGDLLYANSNFARLCGVTLNRLSGQNIFKYLITGEEIPAEEIPAEDFHTNFHVLKNKGFFFNSSLVHPEKGILRLCSYIKYLKGSSGETFIAIVAVEKSLKDELFKLLGSEDIDQYVHALIESEFFFKGLRQALKDNELLKQKSAPELALKFHKSIASLIGYAEHLANETDNLSNKEIKELAGKINAYLKIIYSLSQD